jgi:hypothetical protein
MPADVVEMQQTLGGEAVWLDYSFKGLERLSQASG